MCFESSWMHSSAVLRSKFISHKEKALSLHKMLAWGSSNGAELYLYLLTTQCQGTDWSTGLQLSMLFNS